MLTSTNDLFKRASQDETGIKPGRPAEAFTDLDENVRQSIARIDAPVLASDGEHHFVRGLAQDASFVAGLAWL